MLLAILAVGSLVMLGRMTVRRSDPNYRVLSFLRRVEAYGGIGFVNDSRLDLYGSLAVDEIRSSVRFLDLKADDFGGDLSSVAYLPQLRELHVVTTTQLDFTPLARLNQLERLYVTTVRPNILDLDLASLAGLKALKFLYIRAPSFANLDAIGRITTLHGVRMESGSRSARVAIDLTPLTTLKNLRGLTIFGFHIASLRPLTQMPALRGLLIKGTPLRDLSVLAESKSLRRVDISAFGSVDEEEQLRLLRDANPLLEVIALPDNYDES